MKTIIKFLFALLILFAFSCSQESTQDPLPADLDGVSAKASSKQTATIGGLPNNNGIPITGTSTLHRNKNGITVNFKAENLNPGTYTIWWVIWNKPENCAVENACEDTDFPNFANVEVEVMYAAGHVVGNNGKGNFSGHLNVDDASGSINQEFFGLPTFGGLQAGNTLDAEVHIVLRTHGPKVPGLVNEQISSYGGGCDDPLMYDPFMFYPDAVGECGDIAAAVFAPVN